VDVTRSNHVRWTLPDGQVIRTGLTMRDSNAHRRLREIEKALTAAR
jgi:hypothetical protein